MSNEVFFKPSLKIDSFFGDSFSEDNERFLLFLKAYYEWLQTTTITIVNDTGTFVRDETIIGGTSGATGVIREIKDGAIVIQVNTKKPFAKSEIITGQTSGATATVYQVKDNVVRASGNVVDYRTLENSIDKYFEYLKEELYTSLPVSFYGNKPLIASKFKDFFSSKSNEQSYRFLFRLLYDEEIDFYYPGDDIIRSSDGKYEQTQIIRTTAAAFGINPQGDTFERNIFDFLNKTIRGKTSGALAFVVDIKKFFIGSIETAELTLKLVSADFEAGEEIVDIDDENLNATIYGIIAGININDGGSGYQVGDIVTITGDGAEAQAVVSSIKQSPITSLKVNTVGHGYRLNTTATISNSETGGSGLIVRVTELANTYTVTDANTSNTYTVGEVSKVSIVNRGSGYFASPTITLTDTTIESLGLLSDKLITIDNPGTNYAVGDPLVITANTGANAVGQVASVTANADFSNSLIFEDGFSLVFEQSYDDVLKTEDWDLGSFGPIARIEFTNFGDGYSADYLPTITVNTSTGANAEFTVTGIQGMSANVEVDTANNATGIGSIRAVDISNFGINYTTANASASAYGDGNANLTPIISGIGVNVGKWLDDDGKIDYKILQDSFYYQDYSYVIKSGLTVQTYLDTIKKSIHPAGLQVFGEILLIDSINVTPEFKSAIETIKDFIVRIYDFVTVTPEFDEFKITIETTIESFAALQVALIPNTDIANQEYVIQVVPGGDDTIFVPDVQPYLGREIRVIAPSTFNAEMEAEVAPVRKIYVSTTDTQQGYSIGMAGGLGDQVIYDYASDPISLLADQIFGIYPSSLSGLGERTVFLVRGGGDINQVEDVSINEPTVRVEQELLLFFDNAVTVLLSDVETAQTGTREVVVDRITFVSAYGITLKEIEIGEVGALKFADLIAESQYQGTNDSFANSTFNTTYRTYQKTSTEIHKILPVLNPDGQIETHTEYVLDVYSKGNKLTIYGDDLLSLYSSNTISSFAETRFEQVVGSKDTLEINVSPSPLPTGQAERETEPQDVFRREFNIDLQLFLDMSVRADNLLISATTGTIEVQREIPIIITFDIATEMNREIAVVMLDDSPLVEISVPFSSVVPQKLQTSENLVSAYGVQFKDAYLEELASKTFTEITAESEYQGLNITNGQSNFNSYYRTFPAKFTEVVQKVITIEDNSYVPLVMKEFVVKSEGSGFKFEIVGDLTLSEYANELISSKSSQVMEEYARTSYDDLTIKASPSPFPSGQSVTRQTTDIFSGEYVRQIPSSPEDAYSTEYGDLKLKSFGNETFEYVVPGGTEQVIKDQTFGTLYPQSPVTSASYILYESINGTVANTSIEYSTLTLSEYSNTVFGPLSSKTMESQAAVVLGTDTNFVADYGVGDVFVVNNEYFIAEAVANNTFMTVDRHPSVSYSGISAYRQSI
jgi:hypothetical protein